MKVAGILLAAGRSSRMGGRDKLMEDIDGQPLILDRLDCLQGAADRIVVLRQDRPDRIDAVQGTGAKIVINETPDDGMGSSIAAGIAAIPEACHAALIMPCDMPKITFDDVLQVIDMSDNIPQKIVRGTTAQGRLGHPVLFPRVYFKELLTLTGDTGARLVIKRHMHDVIPVELPDDNAICDLDTPEDWAAWRKERET